jgi:hypothetical protein
MAETGILGREYPNVPYWGDLLAGMESAPTMTNGPPSSTVVAFLNRIQDADPNSVDISEDDTNSNWGHQQFMGGAMTIRSVLSSWSAIGGNDVACRLIAAAIKTCKVARLMCSQRDIVVSSYLSDAYLNELVERLWTLRKDATGVSNYFVLLFLGLTVVYEGERQRYKREWCCPHRSRCPYCECQFHSCFLWSFCPSCCCPYYCCPGC